MLPLAVCLVEKFFFCSSLVSIIKTMTKANLGGGGCVFILLTFPHHMPSSREVRTGNQAGTWRQELKQRPW